jgi:gamma-glutamylcyclotransferase (GGCT)/AIG2-like uncharacterized protein YtfP
MSRKMKEKGPLYFAYGSNMSPEQMQERCPGAELVGPLTLPKGRLVFRQVADIIYDPSSTIAGVVYRLKPWHERVLDRFEGVGMEVYRKKYIALSIKGGPSERCLYYKMSDNSGVAPPTLDYYHRILDGYRAHGLDEEKLNEAVDRSWNDKNLTEDIQRRRRKSTSPIKRRVKPLASNVQPALSTRQVKSSAGKKGK